MKKKTVLNNDVCESIKEDVNKIHENEKAQREKLINEYNRVNTLSQIDEDIIPTDEDVKQYQKEFEDEYNNLTTKTYCIADAESALRVAKFLQKWNREKVRWHKDLWKGVLKFDEEISKLIEKVETDPDPNGLIIDYPALTYLYMVMMEPAGVGIESAKEMQYIDNEYSTILETIGHHIDTFNVNKQYIDLLQQKWAFACQGYKLNILIDIDGNKIN